MAFLSILGIDRVLELQISQKMIGVGRDALQFYYSTHTLGLSIRIFESNLTNVSAHAIFSQIDVVGIPEILQFLACENASNPMLARQPMVCNQKAFHHSRQ